MYWKGGGYLEFLMRVRGMCCLLDLNVIGFREVCFDDFMVDLLVLIIVVICLYEVECK